MKSRGVLLALALAAAPVLAAPKDADDARKLMKEGDALYFENDFAAALQRYQAADAIMHVPSTGIAVAKTQAALGKLVEARDIALTVSRLPPTAGEPSAFVRSRDEAKELAAQLADRIPSIELQIEGAIAEAWVTVTIDGNEIPHAAITLPRKLNPGAHTATATAPGYRKANATFSLKERDAQKIVLKLEKSDGSAGGTTKPQTRTVTTPGPDRSRGASQPATTLMWVGFGVAGAGVLVGSITGILSLDKAKKARDQCRSDDTCPSSAQDEIDSSKSFATISNISFGVAIIGAGVGVYGLLTKKKKTEALPTTGRVTPVIGAGYVGVRSRF